MTERNEEMKKSFIHKFLSMRMNGGDERKVMKNPYDPTEVQVAKGIRVLDSMAISHDVQSLRVFTATWNVGGISPSSDLDLDNLLKVHCQSDIYILGFQEIVPLNAGNVLAIEDNGSAAKWLSLISQSLNKSANISYSPLKSSNTNSYSFERKCSGSSSIFLQRTSLKSASRAFRSESRRRFKSCNCTIMEPERKSYGRDSCFACQKSKSNGFDYASSSEEDDNVNISTVTADVSTVAPPRRNQHLRYSLIKSKQMVGIFVTIWVKKELVPYIGHLRTSCISRGILGYLGNKGCISVSMTFKQTSFCFVSSHLASGEKEGDELRRNSDVIEILKSTQFPKTCRTPNTKVPDKILEHDCVIWLGDLNYRIAFSYHDTKKLLELNDWDALLNKDQIRWKKTTFFQAFEMDTENKKMISSNGGDSKVEILKLVYPQASATTPSCARISNTEEEPFLLLFYLSLPVTFYKESFCTHRKNILIFSLVLCILVIVLFKKPLANAYIYAFVQDWSGDDVNACVLIGPKIPLRMLLRKSH